MPVNEYNAYSYNNVTSKKTDDGSITIHFCGDPKADNFLPIVPGRNYIVRMYEPAPEGLESNWVQTIPNRGFFIYFRLYGPEKERFDRSWKLDDIERIDD